MANNSFGDSFIKRLEKLCKKFSEIDDENDDVVDLNKMSIVEDKGQIKKSTPVVIGKLYKKTYLRNKDIRIKRFDYSNTVQEFNRLYNGLMSNDFEEIYKIFVLKSQ